MGLQRVRHDWGLYIFKVNVKVLHLWKENWWTSHHGTSHHVVANKPMRKGLANRFGNGIKVVQHRGVKWPVDAHIPDDTRGRPPVSKTKSLLWCWTSGSFLLGVRQLSFKNKLEWSVPERCLSPGLLQGHLAWWAPCLTGFLTLTSMQVSCYLPGSQVEILSSTRATLHHCTLQDLFVSWTFYPKN